MFRYLSCFVFAALILTGCQAQPNPSEPKKTAAPVATAIELDQNKKPKPVLVLERPPEPDKTLGKEDLSKANPGDLFNRARDASHRRNYQQAIPLQYWAMKQTGAGHYDLACLYGLAGQKEAAFYWLQEGGREEGADADFTRTDDDFRTIRNDPQFANILRFLRACEEYWAKEGKHDFVLVTPQKYDGKSPIPVAIGLHGMGSNPDNFLPEDSYEALADKLNIAFLGISGTRIRGRNKFVWSEDPEKDLARIEDALKEVADELQVAPGKTILFGFSQGAMVAAEVAARNPDKFAGALILSPGGMGNARTSAVQAQPAHKSQTYYCLVGAKEHPGNVIMARQYAKDLQSLGCQASYFGYPNMATHSLPPDYFQKLPTWISTILRNRGK